MSGDVLTSSLRSVAACRFVGALLIVAFALLLRPQEALATDATVTATGRFAFNTPTGTLIGVRHARIELCDEDGVPWGCSVFATGETADDGRFSLSGTSGDWFWDLPEVEVRVYADSAGAELSNGSSVYCFKTRTQNNAANGSTINFGTVTPGTGFKCAFGGSAADENGAWGAYTWSREAFDFLRGSAAPAKFSGLAGIPGQGLSKQKIKWPADTTAMYSDFSGFQIKAGDEFHTTNVMTVYTIVAMTRRLGTWDPSHNDWDGYFAHFFGAVTAQHFGRLDGKLCSATDPNFCGTPEDPPHTSHTIGGMSYGMSSWGIYWDLFDPADFGDHDANGSSDQLQIPLDVLWSVTRDYDPNPADTSDNHASNVQEFGRGLIAVRPGDETKIRMIFDENHLASP